MKLKIKDIKVGSRIRHETGDLTTLAESIKSIGLLNPIIVNEKCELLNGFRRLEVHRHLGLEEIEVKIFETFSDEIKELDIEYHENVGREDLQEGDILGYQQKRNALLHPPIQESIILQWLKKMWKFVKSIFCRLSAKRTKEHFENNVIQEEIAKIDEPKNGKKVKLSEQNNSHE